MERKCKNCLHVKSSKNGSSLDKCGHPKVQSIYADSARRLEGKGFCGEIGKYFERMPQTENFDFIENPPPMAYWK